MGAQLSNNAFSTLKWPPLACVAQAQHAAQRYAVPASRSVTRRVGFVPRPLQFGGTRAGRVRCVRHMCGHTEQALAVRGKDDSV